MNALQAIVAAAVLCATPADDLRDAVADGQVNPQAATTWRYISLRSIDDEHKPAVAALCNASLNMLAALNVGNVSPAVPVADGRLLRFSITQYVDLSQPEQFKAWYAAWENLASRHPYSRIVGEGLDPSGKLVETNVPGGWIIPPELAQQATELFHSINPVVEAHWFLRESLVPPLYWRFTGIGDEADLLAKLGMDRAELAKIKADRAVTIKKSLVALGKTRRFIEARGPFGGWWTTFDTIAHDAERDHVRHPLGTVVTDQGQAVTLVITDAKETVAVGKNGMPLFNTTNGQGKQVDEVDPRIARDYGERSLGFDGIVVAASRCITCHAERGFNAFDQYQHAQLIDPLQEQRRLGLYQPTVVSQRLQWDQEAIEDATLRSSGATWSDISSTLAWLLRTYEYDDVTPELASLTLGITPEELPAALQGVADPYVQDIVAGRGVTWPAWELSYHAAALAAAAYLLEHPRP